MSQHLIFEDNYKKFGLHTFSKGNLETIDQAKFRPYIKVLFVPENYELTVDFNSYKTESPTLFFATLHFGKKVQYLTLFIYLSDRSTAIPL